MHLGVLFGVRFDPSRLEVRGAPTPWMEDVAANQLTGGGQFDFSGTGTFVYAAGKGAAQKWQVAWLDSSGKTQPRVSAPGALAVPRLSPDRRRLPFSGDGQDIYVHDLERDTPTRLTFGGHTTVPVWTPDGKHIVFGSASNDYSLYWIRSDGAGEPQLIQKGTSEFLPWSFSLDGRRLAYAERSNPETGSISGPCCWTLPIPITPRRESRSRSCGRRLTRAFRDSLPTSTGSPNGRPSQGAR